jgi:hypothetical protein
MTLEAEAGLGDKHTTTLSTEKPCQQLSLCNLFGDEQQGQRSRLDGLGFDSR